MIGKPLPIGLASNYCHYPIVCKSDGFQSLSLQTSLLIVKTSGDLSCNCDSIWCPWCLQSSVLMFVHTLKISIYMYLLCDRCHVEIYAWAGEFRRWDGLHRRVTSFKVYMYPSFPEDPMCSY